MSIGIIQLEKVVRVMANPILEIQREDLFKCFTEQVVKTFHEKRESKALDGEGGRVIRGRSPSSSSDLEDLLALAISRILDFNYSFLVDKAISFKTPNMNRAKTIYPDIMIIKDEVLMGIIELKIDLGFVKKNWSEKYKDSLAEIAKLDNVNYGDKKKLKVGEHLRTNSLIVVLSAGNAHGKLDGFVKDTKAIVIYKRNAPRNKKYDKSNRGELIDLLSQEKDDGWKSLQTFLSKI
jgi:hypothetical protein